MSKFQPQIVLDNKSPIPLYHQLVEEMCRELRQGRVKAGTIIPTILQLSETLKLNRNTIRQAYAILESRHIVERKPNGRLLSVTNEFVKQNPIDNLLTIGLVLPNKLEDILQSKKNNNALKIIAGIMDAAAEKGIASLIVPLPEKDNDVIFLKKWIKHTLSKLSGLIYLGESKGHSHKNAFEILLAEESLPQVFIAGKRFRENLGIIEIDMDIGFRSAVDYLYNLGHRNIAVSGNKIPVRRMFQLQTIDRINCACQAVRQKTTLREDFIYEWDYQPENLMFWLKKILSDKNPPTAIICTDDQNAMLTIECAKLLNFKIPQDLSVIGYGNETENITTIQHPWMHSGRAALNMIVSAWQQNIPISQIQMKLPTELKKGTSVEKNKKENEKEK